MEEANLYSGEDPVFDPVELIIAEENMKNPSFCRSWVQQYRMHQPHIKVEDPMSLSDHDAMILCEDLMACHMVEAMRQCNALH